MNLAAEMFRLAVIRLYFAPFCFRGPKKKAPQFLAGLSFPSVGDTGLEPVTPSLSSWCSNQLS